MVDDTGSAIRRVSLGPTEAVRRQQL